MSVVKSVRVGRDIVVGAFALADLAGMRFGSRGGRHLEEDEQMRS